MSVLSRKTAQKLPRYSEGNHDEARASVSAHHGHPDLASPKGVGCTDSFAIPAVEVAPRVVALWVASAIADEARRTGGTNRAPVTIALIEVAAEIEALFLADSVADLRRQAPVVSADVVVAAVEVVRADVAFGVTDPVAHQSDAGGAAKVAVSGRADRVPIAFDVEAVLRVWRFLNQNLMIIG